MKLLLFLFFSVPLFLLQIELIAQEKVPEIITDRPDITESAIPVLPGYIQFEDGFLLESNNFNTDGYNENIRNYTFSSLLTRIGIVNNFELRIGGDYLYEVDKLNNLQSNNSGFNNILIGGKYRFMNEESDGIDFGLIMQLYLPVGNKSFRPEHVEPEILIPFAKSFTDVLSLSMNIGSHWNSADNIPVYLYSASFGIGINDSWDSFIEIYGDASANSQTTSKFDFGFAYRPVNNFQIDVSAGNGSFSDFNSWFIGAGLSVRLPHLNL